MKQLSTEEQIIYNEGERLIPGVTHNQEEVNRHVSSYDFFKRVIEFDLASHAVPGPIQILDIGFGVGHGCSHLATIPNSQVTGIDISNDCKVYAEKNYNAPNITYVCKDTVEYVRSMTPVHYVVSRGVLEHVPDGLEVAIKSKWTERLMIDVPYDEAAENNQHHILTGITEKDFEDFIGAELFYEDLRGAIYNKATLPSAVRPNMIMCACRSTQLTPVDEIFSFPLAPVGIVSDHQKSIISTARQWLRSLVR